MTDVKASVPEPAPLNRGEPVVHHTYRYLEELKGVDKDTKAEAKALVDARVAFGLKKYGQLLMSEDGRNHEEDCLQELGDAIQYLGSLKKGKKDLQRVRRMLVVLLALVDQD